MTRARKKGRVDVAALGREPDNAGGLPTAAAPVRPLRDSTLPRKLSPKDLLYPKQLAFINDDSQFKIAVTTRQWRVLRYSMQDAGIERSSPKKC